VCFLGDSLKRLRDFPEDALQDAGYQLEKVQHGEQPDDFKPMPAIGKGVEEIRATDESGAWDGAEKPGTDCPDHSAPGANC
jgi:phage-related protein